MVGKETEVEESVGDELCGGRRSRLEKGFRLRWFSIKFERLGGSARSRESGWWRWKD